jgi:hypothetical protein
MREGKEVRRSEKDASLKGTDASKLWERERVF